MTIPKLGTKGHITKVQNKSDIDFTNKYIDISLTNVITNLFSHIILNHINKWFGKLEKINKHQLSFQKATSPFYCIFISGSVISKVANGNTGS